jgi:DNA-binding response OmpR family regulator
MESPVRPSLLIADSDVELRDLYRRYLTGRGYNVETAADGLDCLEKLRRLTPAVCVLDRALQWGGADGVLAWLREEGATSGVSVVLTATAGYDPDGDQDIEPPVVRFLPKPFMLTTLLESVRGIVARNGHEEPLNWNRGSVSPKYFAD